MQLFFGLLSAPYPDIANDPSAVPLDIVREAARQALERTGQWTPPPGAARIAGRQGAARNSPATPTGRGPPAPPAPAPAQPPAPPAPAPAQQPAPPPAQSPAPPAPAPAQSPAPPATPPPAKLVLDTHKQMGLLFKSAPSVPPGTVHPWAARPGKRGRSTDLTQEELGALRHEQQVAERCGMTWAERGPAEGQVSTWRGQAWRANKGRYANRGGINREYYKDLARRGLLKK